MCSYYAIMSFQPGEGDSEYQTSNVELKGCNESRCQRVGILSESGSRSPGDSYGLVMKMQDPSPTEYFDMTCSSSGGDLTEDHGSTSLNSPMPFLSANSVHIASPFYQLRKEATTFVSQTLERGRRNLWQLTTSRVPVLLSCCAVSSTSTFQFLNNYKDLNIFILAGESFCGVEATEFRQRLKSVSENYVAGFHRQNVYERCVGAETISLVAHVLHKSKVHLQSMLFQHCASIIDDFYGNVVDSVPDLTEHIHRTTARMLLHINGYADKIANAKWEVKELGLEHNGFVDLLLGEFKRYKTRLAHGGISKEVQDLLLEYGLENVAETLIEGLSRVKRCTDEGRVLMSLDLQVLINGLQHFVSVGVMQKLQVVATFIKAFYLPETEYVHWARSHPEYSRSQIVGLVNLVATMKGWKRKTRLEILERLEVNN